MDRSKRLVAFVAVVVLAAAGSAAAAPAVGKGKPRPSLWSGLAARAAVVFAAPGERGAVPPRADRLAPRRIGAEGGCMIDPNGRSCKPGG